MQVGAWLVAGGRVVVVVVAGGRAREPGGGISLFVGRRWMSAGPPGLILKKLASGK